MNPFEGYEAEDYSPDFMMWIASIESFQALALADWLFAHYRPHNVVDVGSGPGIYLTGFRAKGAYVSGMDAFEGGHLPLAGAPNYRRVDLRLPLPEMRRGQFTDLALCLEVAEHLKPEFADTLIDTLTSITKRIVFSAATPGQGGLHHYNEQPMEYWLEKFDVRGFALAEKNDEFQAWLLSLTPYREQNRVCGWFIDHTVIVEQR